MKNILVISRYALGYTALLGANIALAQSPTFKQDVLPILQQNCVSCHITGEELGGLGLAPSLAYKQLVNKPAVQAQQTRVVPGDPEKSYLVHKLSGTHLDNGGTGGRMPLGFPQLSDANIDVIKAWIAAGALDN